MEKQLLTGEGPVVERLFSGNEMPLLISSGKGANSLSAWIAANKQHFEDGLTHHGGILFRGFGIDTVESFNHVMKCFQSEPIPYMFRSSPREELAASAKNIYRSTSYPQERSINMHNESSYSRIWGMKIVFCSIQPAEQGGETPLADSRNVLKDIDGVLVEKFRQKGVKYRRNLLPNLGMPWQEVFQTGDKAVVQEVCLKYAITYEFRNQDHLIIEWTKPAVYRHPVSGEETWFNHIMFFNKFSRYAELGLSEDDMLPDDYLVSDTFFGDGTVISFAEYTEICNAYRKNIVSFPWQRGDVLFLDNMLTAHGRYPYKGERTIATAIIEPASDEFFSPIILK